jgi:hypothetical protein
LHVIPTSPFDEAFSQFLENHTQFGTESDYGKARTEEGTTNKNLDLSNGGVV